MWPAAQAPQAAVGFRVVVQKWLVLVRLLLGEVPEREELIERDLERPLRPYFQLTNAVRIGDLTAFRSDWMTLRPAPCSSQDPCSTAIVCG